MPSPDEPSPDPREPVLVVGAGPAGLAVAKCLEDLQVAARLVDAHGAAGGAYARMYARLTLSSPSAYLGLPGVPLRNAPAYLSAAQYLAYLRAYAAQHALVVERRRVTRIRRVNGYLRVEYHEHSSDEAYAAVVVATGMCDHPIYPEIPGLAMRRGPPPPVPRVLHARDWSGPDEFREQRILIVGGGMRAVEIAEECVSHGLRPIVSVRGRFLKPLPRRLLGVDSRFVGFPLLHRLPTGLVRRRCIHGWRFRGIDHGFNRYVSRGAIVLKPRIVRLRGETVRFADSSETAVDVIVLATGYRFDTCFLPEEIPRSSQGYPLVTGGSSRGSPGLFVVGVPCALRADSQFIHGMAADAPVVARAALDHLRHTGSAFVER